MTKPVKFITFQFLGWSLFSVTNLAIRSVALGWQWSEFYSTLVLTCTCIAVSWQLRRPFRRLQQTQAFPFLKFGIVVLLSLLAGVTTNVLVFALLELVAEPIYGVDSVFSWPSFLINLFNVSMLMLIWSAFYFGIKRYRRYEQIKQEKLALDSSMKEVRLEALINQLNPHFMFNTINNIRALILEDSEKARLMLSHLADMYRYSLNSEEEHLVPLAVELNMVNDYLQLMSIQLEDRLQTQINISDAVTSTLIPRMMLQLLVENAIKYGIADRKAGGCLTINGKAIAESLWLTVSNPGKLAQSKTKSTGIGLKNIQQRLQLLFGDKASVSLSEENEQVSVTLKLPLEQIA